MEYFGVPIVITSVYRSSAHNKKVDGASNSYHVKGQAADHHAKNKVNSFGAEQTHKQNGKCTGNGVRLRKSASLTGKILKKLYKSDEFDILGTSGSWTKIKHNGTIGYVSSQYVKL